MKNRPRPYIPISVRIRVAQRQLLAHEVDIFQHSRAQDERLETMLRRLLALLAEKLGCTPKDLRLDHTLALRLRGYNPRKKDIAARYTPNANDPDYMAYIPNTDHHHKTNRRNGAQFCDTVLIKRERKREKRALGMVKRKTLIPSRPFPKGRPFQSRP